MVNLEGDSLPPLPTVVRNERRISISIDKTSLEGKLSRGATRAMVIEKKPSKLERGLTNAGVYYIYLDIFENAFRCQF